MKRLRTMTTGMLVGLVFLSALLDSSSRCALAQDAAATKMDNARHVPDDALAAILVSPTDWLDNPMVQMMPIEVFRVTMQEQFGVDPANIAEIRAVVALDPQTMQPQVGSITKITGGLDFEKLLETFLARPDSIQINGHDAFSIEGPPGTVVSMIDDESLYIGSASYLQPMLDAKNGTGELPALLRTMPRQSGITVAMVMEQIRPIVSGLAMQNAGNLAPDLQPLAQIPGLTDAIKIHVDFSEDSGKFRIALVGTDEVAAQRIESILIESVVAARVLGIAELNRSMVTSDQSDAMREAMSQYANRMADMVAGMVKPKLRGEEVSIEMESQVSIATTGVLVGLLLPAVQAARQAAQRMSSSNNLKQIMLAMHNYHAAYNRLPPAAIMDDAGKPLLSWRVAILPFIEEQELYQKFHLDEPWDSEHNLPLSKELPVVYATPGLSLEPGLTIMQAAVGDDIGMRPDKKTAFRDFLDGLSNTILIFEVNPDAAVVWSKPEDIEIDLEDPLANLGKAKQGGFHVGMGDGAVKFVSASVNPELFKKLLTRAGNEVTEDF